MRKVLNCLSAVALVSTLAACGGREESANVAAENDMNAMMNAEAMQPVEPVANVSTEPPASETSAPRPSASKPATPAKPTPAKPEPAAPKADPHAGMDMGNMSNHDMNKI